MRIAGHTIDSRFLTFVASSLACTVVDQGLAWILFAVLEPMMPGMDYQRILIGTYVARAVSIAINYNLNLRLVFGNERRSHALARYLVLAAGVALLSSLGVWVCSTQLGLDERIAKILVDLCLFFVNYNVQRTWVFSGKPDRSDADGE